MRLFLNFFGGLLVRYTVAGALLLSTRAEAQVEVVQPQTSGSIFGAQTDVSVGLGAGIDQRYMGSKDFRPLILPVFSISRGIFFADSIRGAGVQYQSNSGFYIGEALNYDPGRDNEDNLLRPGSDILKELGSVKETVTSTLTVSQQIVSWFSINAQAELGLDGHKRGNQYQFGVESVVLHDTKDSLTLDLDVKLGDSKYNQTYFGVTRSQSTSSGFPHYEAGLGIYAYTLNASWDHMFDKHWSAQLMVGGTRYTNRVTDSPIVQRKFGITILPSVSYAF